MGRLVRGFVLVAVSVALHGLPLRIGERATREVSWLHGSVLTKVVARRDAAALTVIDHARLAAERKSLVDEARRRRASGTLELGWFLSRAGALDEREHGRELNLADAEEAYAQRLRRLRDELERSDDVQAAVYAGFGDMHYRGTPGGTVPRALLLGGGSCEPLAQLLAAALYDAGRPRSAQLRFYGGSPVSHLAPVYRYPSGREQDLMSGRVPESGGKRFAAAELVDVYARAHGIDEALPGSASSAVGDSSAAFDPEPSMAAGYPPSQDAYGGEVPLYAARAIAARANHGIGAVLQFPDWGDQPDYCSFVVGIETLNRPRASVVSPSGQGVFETEVVAVPRPQQVEYVTHDIARHEQRLVKGKLDVVERLVANACIALAAEQAAIDLAIVGRPGLSALAVGKARLGRRRAVGLARAGLSPEDQRRLFDMNDSWVVLSFAEGRALAMTALVRWLESDRQGTSLVDQLSRGKLLAGLFAHPQTRAETVSLIEQLPEDEQVGLMPLLTILSILPARAQFLDWPGPGVDDLDGDFVRGARAIQRMQGRFHVGGEAGEVLQQLRDAGMPERYMPIWERHGRTHGQ